MKFVSKAKMIEFPSFFQNLNLKAAHLLVRYGLKTFTANI